MKFSIAIALALSLSVSASPSLYRRQSFALQNGEDAVSQQNAFDKLTTNSPCTAGQDACVDKKFAQCVSGKFVITGCAATTSCFALPLVNSKGTSIACTTQDDFEARIKATGASLNGSSSSDSGSASSSNAATATSSTAAASSATAAVNNTSNQGSKGGDPQTSDTLDPSVIAQGFENNGQAQAEPGQVASLTSSNNFINFCLTVPNKPITNGKQIETGSCNPAPMGVIASSSNMPSSKFTFPKNTQTIPANKSFNISMKILHVETGHFTSATDTYYAAPQQINSNGDIIGHSHFIIEKLDSLDQTEPTDPSKFVFFKGVNSVAVNGVLSTPVDKGLPAGVYRLASINSAANHQPVLVAIAQHGSLDDQVYFTTS